VQEHSEEMRCKIRLSGLTAWLLATLPVLILSLPACDQLKLTHYLKLAFIDTLISFS